MRNHGSYIIQDCVDIKFDVFDLQLAGFYLGEIKDAVDETQQGNTRIVYLADVIALPRVQVRLQRQIRETYNGIHGGANLVAHIGQKITFGMAGRLRRLLGNF